MELSTYAAEAIVEESHWWFVTRRKLFSRILREWSTETDATILDIGTSTGTNLRMLRDLGYRNYRGLDLSDEAIRWCADKGLGQVTKGDVCSIPFENDSFDVVLATDIIEHVDDDSSAVSEIARVLKPDGRVIITVPAFESLWGLQDDVSRHRRRYLKPQLLEIVRNAELDVEDNCYFNYLLFGPIWTARMLMKLLGEKPDSENQVNTRMLNRILEIIFTLDIKTARFVHPPFGVSILATARKPSLCSDSSGEVRAAK